MKTFAVLNQKNYPLYSRVIGKPGKRLADGSLAFFVEVGPKGEVLDGYSVLCSPFLTYDELHRVFRLKDLAKFAAGAD